MVSSANHDQSEGIKDPYHAFPPAVDLSQWLPEGKRSPQFPSERWKKRAFVAPLPYHFYQAIQGMDRFEDRRAAQQDEIRRDPSYHSGTYVHNAEKLSEMHTSLSATVKDVNSPFGQKALGVAAGKLIKGRDGRCGACEEKISLEAGHVIDKRQNISNDNHVQWLRSERIESMFRKDLPSNVVALCPQHHNSLDQYIWTFCPCEADLRALAKYEMADRVRRQEEWEEARRRDRKAPRPERTIPPPTMLSQWYEYLPCQPRLGHGSHTLGPYKISVTNDFDEDEKRDSQSTAYNESRDDSPQVVYTACGSPTDGNSFFYDCRSGELLFFLGLSDLSAHATLRLASIALGGQSGNLSLRVRHMQTLIGELIALYECPFRSGTSASLVSSVSSDWAQTSTRSQPEDNDDRGLNNSKRPLQSSSKGKLSTNAAHDRLHTSQNSSAGPERKTGVSGPAEGSRKPTSSEARRRVTVPEVNGLLSASTTGRNRPRSRSTSDSRPPTAEDIFEVLQSTECHREDVEGGTLDYTRWVGWALVEGVRTRRELHASVRRYNNQQVCNTNRNSPSPSVPQAPTALHTPGPSTRRARATSNTSATPTSLSPTHPNTSSPRNVTSPRRSSPSPARSLRASDLFIERGDADSRSSDKSSAYESARDGEDPGEDDGDKEETEEKDEEEEESSGDEEVEEQFKLGEVLVSAAVPLKDHVALIRRASRLYEPTGKSASAPAGKTRGMVSKEVEKLLNTPWGRKAERFWRDKLARPVLVRGKPSYELKPNVMEELGLTELAYEDVVYISD